MRKSLDDAADLALVSLTALLARAQRRRAQGRGARLLDKVYPCKGNRMPIRARSKPGRNKPCPCGSGRKWKHCCAR